MELEVELERPKQQRQIPRLRRQQTERLQDRVKLVQKERTKVNKQMCLEKIRNGFVRQRARYRIRPAEEVTLVKDSVTGKASEVIRNCWDQGGNLECPNGTLYRDIGELQRIIRQSSKERLQLERHLARATEVAQRTAQVDLTKYVILQETNESLRHRLEELYKTITERQDAELRLEGKENELQEVRKELNQRRELCADLERQLHVTLEKKDELEEHSRQLERQLSALQPVNEECRDLRNTLEVVRSNYQLAQSELVTLQGKVDSLESLVKHMREAADRRRELEKQHGDALAELRKKQDEVQHLHYTSKSEKLKALETIQGLESKVRELQKKCELQNVRHEELVLEMATLRRSQAKQSWRSQRSQSADMPTEGTRLDQDMDIWGGSDTLFTGSRGRHLSSSLPALDLGSSRSLTTHPTVDNYRSTSLTSTGATATVTSTTLATSPLGASLLDSTSHEIDRILYRIEQDNRILAELEKSRATVGSPVSTANIERLRAQFEEDNKQLEDMAMLRTNLKPSVTMQELDLLMAKLEQDNRILAELDRKRANIGLSSTFAVPQFFQSGRGSYSATPPGSRSSTPMAALSSLSGTAGSGHYSSILPAVPTTGYTVTPSQIIPHLREHHVTAGTREEDMLGEDLIDYIDLPGRGRCKVFLARYSYDPLKQSPNENPEAELCLNAGDYVLIFGEMDEDGFFSGELLDGRKGLVPSNFVEKLVGEDLFDFQAQVLYGNRDSDDSSATFSYGNELDFIGGEDTHMLPPEDFHRMNDYIDLEDIEELDEDDLSDLEREEGPVPPPQRLILERQLNKSILIGWLPPDAPSGAVEAYHVYVDGVPKATIRSSEKTRALIEGVDSSQPHRISVRSVNPSGRHSRDAACTIVIGKDIPLAPSCVKASNITSTSAVISWLPSNSNFQHVVAVNSVEVRVVKPGIFRHTITGLAPNTTYRVSVRARPGRLFYNNDNPKKMEMLSATVEFRTLPKGTGLPDPPVDIQVEAGPQDGTLLVTWLPVTINPMGTSNGAPVTGYAIYAGDKKVTEIDSPTGDHALLDIVNIAPLKKRSVTVRTKSGDSLSADSMTCVIPLDLLKGVAASVPESISSTDPPREQRERRRSSSDSESDTELAELLKHVTRRSEAFDPAENPPFGSQQGGRLEDLFEEGVRSELSDIAEEPEEDINQGLDKSRDRRTGVIKDKSTQRDRGQERGETERTTKHSSRPTNEPRSRESRHGRVSPPGGHRDRSGRERAYSSRGNEPMSESQRRQNSLGAERRNSAGQVIIEPEENLSDKEIYPHSHHITIPAIEITRDSASEGCNSENFSEEEYLRNNRHGHYVESHKSRGSSHYYRGDRDVPRPVSPMPPIRSRRDPENSYYGHRGQSRTHREDFHSNGHRVRVRYRGFERGVIKSPPDNRVRWFVALFDYDPQTMSPNPDAVEEELPFQEGALIKVYGEKDADGFYRGESTDGRIGYVPCNMVSEVQMEDEEMSRQLMNENVSTRHHHRPPPGDGTSDPWSTLPVRRMIALYDYDPQELSPNVDAEMELAFSTGDVIYVYGGMDEDGFYMGELNGVRGLVPSNFLTEAPPDYRDTRPPSDKLAPPSRAEVGRSKEPRESSQYSRSGGSSGATSKDHHHHHHHHLPPDKGMYPPERSGYDRSSNHPSDRGHYSSGRSGQHW